MTLQSASRKSEFEFLLRIIIATGHAGVAIPAALTTTREIM